MKGKVLIGFLLLWISLFSFDSKAASLENISFEHIFGQMLMVGFKGSHGVMDPAMESLIREGMVGNTILFTRNIDPAFKNRAAYRITPPAEPDRLRVEFKEFMDHLAFLNSTAFRAMDMEGGLVQRFMHELGYPQFPSAAEIGAAYESKPEEGLAIAATQYAQMALLLKDYHINFNLGPVLDLIPGEGDCPVISALKRAYSKDPETVATLGESFITAHKAQGIVICAKHGPGHGYAKGDTHFALTDVTEPSDPEKELKPYKLLAVKGLLPAVMMAHVVNGKLDADKRPATVSSPIIQHMREIALGNGLALCDALEMGGLHDWYRQKYPELNDKSVDLSALSALEMTEDSRVLASAVPELDEAERIRRMEARWKRIVIDAVMAGEDLLLLCNVDASFVTKVIGWAKEVAESNADFMHKVREAYVRITDTKRAYGIVK